MLPDWVSNPGPLTYESGALPIALRGPAIELKCSRLHIMFKAISNGHLPQTAFPWVTSLSTFDSIIKYSYKIQNKASY